MNELPRFYLTQAVLQGRLLLSEEDTRHIRKVLRLTRGDRIALCDGAGHRAVAVLTDGQQGLAEIEVEAVEPMESDPPFSCRFYPSLSKGDRFEWMLQKLCELGASEITPVISERCISREWSEQKQLRLRRILLEAAKQCGRAYLPVLQDPVPFAEAVTAVQGGVKLFCYEESRDSMKTALQDAAARREAPYPTAVHILTGPEGGYTKDENQRALESGWRSVTLGRIILRCETAPIAAAAAILYEYGQM